MNCAKCRVAEKICRVEKGKWPKGCPTIEKRELMNYALEKYDLPENSDFARLSSIQEAECYANRGQKPFRMNPIKPRVEEIIEFSKKMGYSKLGVAFCGGVTNEASILVEILEKHGFEVVAVSCKVGGISKERLGVKEEEKIRIGEFEPMCNPIAQAMFLNEEKTDFNIMVCLCVGHDSLFLKYINPPTTVLATKDRVTCHNPLAVLYTSNSYYQRIKNLELGNDEEVKARLAAKKNEDLD